MRLLLACAMTAILVLAGAAALDVEPANAADGPQRDADHLLVAAAVEGCSAGLGLARVEVQAGVVVVTCRPDLGVLPVVKRGGR